jgi:hypothetical protein
MPVTADGSHGPRRTRSDSAGPRYQARPEFRFEATQAAETGRRGRGASAAAAGRRDRRDRPSPSCQELAARPQAPASLCSSESRPKYRHGNSSLNLKFIWILATGSHRDCAWQHLEGCAI